MRYAIFGKCQPTGIGSMNYDLARLGEHCHLWLLPAEETVFEAYLHCGKDTRRMPAIDDKPHVWREALHGLDYLVFVERPAVKQPDALFDVLQATQTKVVCIPNWEGFPSKGWGRRPDVIWCTSRFTRRFVQDIARQDSSCRWRNAIYGTSWGVDPTQFVFRQRNKCERFLFVNGHGGQQQRKGLDTLISLLQHHPQLPFVVRSTAALPQLPGKQVKVLCTTTTQRRELYTVGDVLVSLSHWEGLGLQGLEAMASGLPTLLPDYPPINEQPAFAYLPGRITKQVRLRVRAVPFWESHVTALAEILYNLLGSELAATSSYTRVTVAQSTSDLRETVREFERTLQTLC